MTDTDETLLLVHVAPMTQPHHDHHQYVVLDRVDDAVIADADTKARAAPEGPCTWRSRIVGEQGDRAVDATANLRVELAQVARRGRSKLDPISAHTQPRSALTCSQGMFGPSSAIAASKATMSSASSKAVISCS